jgi:2-methylisocitrate lyase-like PEP mutase family enzyme
VNDIGSTFRALHQKGNPFILANAWDLGSAKMLASMGARAIATSSAAQAFTLGKPDGVTRDEALAHAQALVSAVSIPVSGDFENGFGDDPETVAETIRLAFEAGLAGCSIEDTALPGNQPYDFAFAVERVMAAVAAARALPRDFVLVARADGVMHGQYDIAEGLRRIRAFDEAGADCLYIPYPASLEDVKATITATAKPVNVLISGPYAKLSRDDYAAMGAARLSLGSSLARATHRVIHDAAKAMFERKEFTPLTHTISGSVIDGMLK